jgi:hypothetical protein
VSDAVRKFRTELDDFVVDADVVQLDDDAWWERFGELLDDVLAAKAHAKRAARQAVQCSITRSGGVVRCVLRKNHNGDHFNSSTGRW